MRRLEVLAQLVNERRSLNLASEVVKIATIGRSLPAGDALHPALAVLHVNVGKTPFPADPYSGDGLMWRSGITGIR